jgi:hypothetical protein
MAELGGSNPTRPVKKKRKRRNRRDLTKKSARKKFRVSEYHTFISQARPRRGRADFRSLSAAWRALTPIERARVKAMLDSKRTDILAGHDVQVSQKDRDLKERQERRNREEETRRSEVRHSLLVHHRVPSDSAPRDHLVALARQPSGLQHFNWTKIKAALAAYRVQKASLLKSAEHVVRTTLAAYNKRHKPKVLSLLPSRCFNDVNTEEYITVFHCFNDDCYNVHWFPHGTAKLSRAISVSDPSVQNCSQLQGAAMQLWECAHTPTKTAECDQLAKQRCR